MAELPPHTTCIETTTFSDLPDHTYVCGPKCPRPAGPDAQRDERIKAYRDRERRRAARALDRYIQALDVHCDGPMLGVTVTDVAGERFVEQVGDYVLARVQDGVRQHRGVGGSDALMNCQTCGAKTSCGGACDECAAAHRALRESRDVVCHCCNRRASQIDHAPVQQNADYGPRCTCVRASDTGHDPDCPRAAFARGAAPRMAMEDRSPDAGPA